MSSEKCYSPPGFYFETFKTMFLNFDMNYSNLTSFFQMFKFKNKVFKLKHLACLLTMSGRTMAASLKKQEKVCRIILENLSLNY